MKETTPDISSDSAGRPILMLDSSSGTYPPCWNDAATLLRIPYYNRREQRITVLRQLDAARSADSATRTCNDCDLFMIRHDISTPQNRIILRNILRRWAAPLQ